MRSRIIDVIDRISNLKWDIIFDIKILTDKNFRKSLRKNIDLKNKYQGKRCFIVGNGPSLRSMDLTKLQNEITFTVNNIMYDRNIYNTINTDYHVLIDPLYFCLNPTNREDISTIELLKSINYSKKRPVCISSYEGFDSFNQNGLAKTLDIYYIYQHRNFVKAYSRPINLTKNIPSSQNVVQAAIFSAMYMGFKEIYLIGCDMTSIFLTYEANREGEHTVTKDFHAYKYNESELRTMTRDSNKHDNEFMLYDYAKTFTIFKRIEKYAGRFGVKIYNATIAGGLDIFERVKYETLFDE